VSPLVNISPYLLGAFFFLRNGEVLSDLMQSCKLYKKNSQYFPQQKKKNLWVAQSAASGQLVLKQMLHASSFFCRKAPSTVFFFEN
jgi:hypothetical protein